jgi:hypothetical protein
MRIADVMAVIMPMGAMANRILSNTVKDDSRNYTITFSPNRVIRGPRSDAALFAKVLALIADAEAAQSAITTIVIHIVAAVPISLRLGVIVEGRGKRNFEIGEVGSYKLNFIFERC